MRRTRSLKKMKLPLRRPSTRSSPSGYASVISSPSSRTRRAIVASSKTICLSSRPPVCLRLAVLGNIHSHRRGSRPREVGSTPADSGDPENGFAARDDRVLRPVAARHTRLHQEAPHRPMPRSAERHQPVAGADSPDLPVPARDPGGPVAALHAGGRALRRPLDPELAELGSAPLLVLPSPHHLHTLPHPPTLPPPPHAAKRPPRRPPPPERPAPPRRTPSEPRQLPRPSRSQDQPRAPRRGTQHGHGQCVIKIGR